ncbi:F-box protein At3g07870-like [Macadamia integrifolia]|uniref:F-box protein At3g07870-like n=1 Tax=Macadamia integrifolia TaxID=60698 RepID=UPI001C52DFF3|nr:F-box protein At3g07870-like [Macadamia integrifolia]
MKDYNVMDSWVKEFSIERCGGLYTKYTEFDDTKPVCYLKNGEIILKIEFLALFLYDPSRGSYRTLGIRGVPYRFETMICVGSLVPLDAKDGAEQAEMEKKKRKQRLTLRLDG